MIVHLKSEVGVTLNIQVFNSLGQLMYLPPTKGSSLGMISQSDTDMELDTSTFPTGAYLLKIKTEKGVMVKKFIKQE